MQAILDLSLTEEKLSARFNPSLTEKIVAFKQILVRVLTKGGTASIRYVYASRANEYVVSPAFTSKLQQLLELSRSALASADVSAECLSARELFRLYQTEAPERRALSFSGNPLAVRYEEGIVLWLRSPH